MTLFRSKVNGATLIASVLMWCSVYDNLSTVVLAMPSRSKEYHKQNIASSTGEVVNNKYNMDMSSEPSCEELKAMWRFSKRQSRASEVTNEIPTYKDPFSNNVWESYYPSTRSIGGMRAGRFRNRPIYGRIVHKPPHRDRQIFQVLTEQYGATPRGLGATRPRITAFRLGGGGGLHVPITPHGSFQHLKELIRTERARELQEQRLAEEAAARATAFKDMSGGYFERTRQQNLRNEAYPQIGYDDLRDEETAETATPHVSGILAFPNILARDTRLDNGHANILLDQQTGPQEIYQRHPLYAHDSIYNRNLYTDGLDSRQT